MTYFPPQSGPCIICGDTNYDLSCGGPTICPKCDCGSFDAATVQKQAQVIVELRKEIAILRDVLMNPDPDSEPDVIRLHREKCEALDEVHRLLQYANHLTSCRYRSGHDCDCGLDEIREKHRSPALTQAQGDGAP